MSVKKRAYKVLLNFLLFAGLALFVSACSTESHQSEPIAHDLTTDTGIKHAKRFAISNGKGFKIIHLFGKANSKDTTANFVVYTSEKPDIALPNVYFVKAPCSRIISLSSIYSSMISILNSASAIVGIENCDYYTNSAIIERCKQGHIKELQRSPDLDKEQTISLRPDVIFAFGMGKSPNEFDQKIIQSGIPVVVSLDHLEASPLARAEWIKFFAVFVGKERMADSIFNNVSVNYEKLRTEAGSIKDKPTVFTELKYGDTWYVPGGNSFMAQMIHDAGANYVWRDDSSTGSLPLSFENVFTNANGADFWLNVSMCNTLNDMVKQDVRYSQFKAYKTKQVFNNNKIVNLNGYSAYWETGMIFPDRLLQDLITIFQHKDSKELSALHYYKQLN